MLALSERANAIAPLCEVTAAYCDYPLKPDERAVYQVVVRYAGWEGGWCERTAEQIVMESLIPSTQSFYDLADFLTRIHLLEKQGSSGRIMRFRPLPLSGWAEPERLAAIRAEVEMSGLTGQAAAPFQAKVVLPFPLERQRLCEVAGY